MQSKPPAAKMTSATFSEFVLCLEDLYNLAKRNSFHLPDLKSAAINEVMLVGVLRYEYWCPKVEDIRIKNCVKPPLKEVIAAKVWEICTSKQLNIAWMDPAHIPNKKWLLEVLATLKPEDEIFRKDYVAPPVRKRLRDIETIVLPDELFKDMPKSTSKVKARRLKVVSQAFAAEKTTRLKEMQKHILDEIITHEERVESFHDKLKVQKMIPNRGLNQEEEKKGPMPLATGSKQVPQYLNP
jgi:hypothetical protein